MSGITRPSSAELANPDSLTRDDVLSRLEEWRTRVHSLYDDIAHALAGQGFMLNREGKHTSSEPLVQAVGLSPEDQPKIDILRIERSDGTTAATFLPRSPWVIGANGRIDLRVSPRGGPTRAFILMDQSGPFSPPSWVRMPTGAPFERDRFDHSWLLTKLN
jgi:hypothetical protein